METTHIFPTIKRPVSNYDKYIIERDENINTISEKIDSISQENIEIKIALRELLLMLAFYQPGNEINYAIFSDRYKNLDEKNLDDDLYSILGEIRIMYNTCKPWVNELNLILGNFSSRDHEFSHSEAQSVIKQLKQTRKIFTSDVSLESIQENLQKIQSGNKKTFYLLLKNNNDNGYYWSSAKIRITNKNVYIKYANPYNEDYPSALIDAITAEYPYPGHEIHIKYRKEVLQASSPANSFYLSIFNIMRDLDSHSQIGAWNNEEANISQLNYWIRKTALLSFGFKENLVDNKIKPKNELPFARLITESVNDLLEYKSNRENSFRGKWSKEKYKLKLDQAEAIATSLAKCENDESLDSLLEEIRSSRETVQVNDPKSKLISKLELIERKIEARKQYKVEDDEVENLYQQYSEELKNANPGPEVQSDRYTWLGHDLLTKNIPGKHTVRDKVMGELASINDNPLMNDKTKCVEMRMIMRLWKANADANYANANPASGLEKYRKLWNDSTSNNDVDRAIHLLKNYDKSPGWAFLFGDWNRSYRVFIRQAVKRFSKNENLTIDDILECFSKRLNETTNPDGALYKTACVIAEQTGRTFKLEVNNVPIVKLVESKINI